ncbi:MAG TPA: DNA primase [Candidatus Babeliales bacterium]|nr:DNA primase [Candidatus Babeliales bacterium]
MSLFNFIKGHVSIIDVVSEYASLKKAGLYLKGNCPFHHEKTASFTVSPHKEIYYCFGCHSGGDVISFIAKAEQCTQLEAAQYLAERYNIQIPQEYLSYNKEAAHQKTDEKKRYWLLCNLIAQWCHEQLKKNKDALAYIKQRSINDETIERFKIGYFPQSPQAIKDLIDVIRQHHFMAQDLLTTNVVSESKGMYYSPLADRIIFPIADPMGRRCGFGGRIFRQNDERPKYYNCKESPYFSKGSLLFGFDLAKKEIQAHNGVYLVEGYMDCLMMAQYGFLNTVATLGTACTPEQLKLLSRYAQQVFVLYDGDDAGKKAMLRLTQLCWQVNLELRVIELPKKEDPDSFLRKGGNLAPLAAAAHDIFIFFVDTVGSGFINKTLHEKMDTIRELIQIIGTVEDPLKKDILLQRVAKTCDIPFQALASEAQRQGNFSSTSAPNGLPESDTPRHSPSSLAIALKEVPLLEKKLFSVIINNMNLLKNEDEEYLTEYATPPVRDLLIKLQLLRKESEPVDFSLFFEHLSDQEKVLMSQLLLECHEYDGPENFDYLLTQFQKKNWKSFVTDTKIKLNRAKQENDEPGVQKILTHFQELKQKLVSRGLI